MIMAMIYSLKEPILEPTCIRCDMKRCVGYQQACSSARDLLAVGADVTVDTVLLNLGQKDLATILAVWTDNLSIEHFIGKFSSSWSTSI